MGFEATRTSRLRRKTLTRTLISKCASIFEKAMRDVVQIRTQLAPEPPDTRYLDKSIGARLEECLTDFLTAGGTFKIARSAHGENLGASTSRDVSYSSTPNPCDTLDSSLSRSAFARSPIRPVALARLRAKELHDDREEHRSQKDSEESHTDHPGEYRRTQGLAHFGAGALGDHQGQDS